MKQVIIAFIALIAVLALVALSQSGMLNIPLLTLNTKKPTVTVDEKSFTVKVVRTPEEKTVGLSKTTSLGDNEGMLFTFEQKDRYSFWMRDMKIPIDIIFIDDNKVVDIVKNAEVPAPNTSVSDLTIYQSKAPANYVLEIKAGLSDRYGIEVNDSVEFANL